jgi:uncharacterized repeat protein (TIGR01451 family)
MSAAPAQAAPGDPFPAGDSLIFVAQGIPTQLFVANTNSAGEVVFTPQGPPAPLAYNAISYNYGNNYLYGIAASDGPNIPAFSLIRIGQQGVVTRIGTGTYPPPASPGLVNVGAFHPGGLLYVASSPANSNMRLQAINVATGAIVQNVALSSGINASDITWANGFFWGIDANTPNSIQRIDPATGQVTNFPSPIDSAGSPVGAAWTYGNGNLGFSTNNSGVVTQIAVANPASASPTFTVVATSPGPASSNNDGALSPGVATDLAITKTAPAVLAPGGTVTYTLTVRNNGAGNSSGYVVNDTLPAPLTGVASTTPGCTVTGNAVRCVGGRLVAGATAVYTITASVPASATSAVSNTATVLANEQDPVAGNNTSTVASGLARLALVKRAGAPTDVNANGLVDAGDAIRYTFDVTNSGTVGLSSLGVNDPKIGAVTCAVTVLAAGATTTCSAVAAYTITAADATAGAVNNTAAATAAATGGVTVTSPPSSTSTPVTTDAPAISLVKSADRATATAAGQTIAYSFLVTNAGNVPLTGVRVDEVAFSGSGDLPSITCPAAAASLAPAAQVTCTVTYVVTQADMDAGTLANSATATGTPRAGNPPVSPPSAAVVALPAAPGITLAKTATPTVITSVGQDIAYSFLVTNTGNVTLTAIAVNETAFSGSGAAPTVTCPAGPLAPAATATCTAGYPSTTADVEAGEVTNTAVAVGAPPTGATVTSEPSSARVTVFHPTLPLTGGTPADLVVLLGGAAVLVALLLALRHLRRLRRDEESFTSPTTSAPLR